jgi:hypothetical protein
MTTPGESNLNEGISADSSGVDEIGKRPHFLSRLA